MKVRAIRSALGITPGRYYDAEPIGKGGGRLSVRNNSGNWATYAAFIFEIQS